MLGYNILSDKIHNTHYINILQIALKKMPFLRQEGRLHHPRRACSRILLGLFFYLKDHVLLS